MFNVNQSICSYFFKLICLGIFAQLLSHGASAQTYCTPSPAGGNNFIIDVQTTLGMVNISNATGSSGYTNYSATQEVSAVIGTSVNFTVNTCGGGCSPSYCKIWVDWNQDGDFTDAGEEVYALVTGGGAYSFTGTITVPATATVGTTRMRVATDWFSAATFGFPAIGPCVSTSWGESEDYAFTVIASTPCEDITLEAGTISLPDSVCPSTPFTVLNSGSSVALGLNRIWQSRTPSGTGTWTTIAGATGLNYMNPAGITAATDYRSIITCPVSGLADTTNIHTVDMKSFIDCYCEPFPAGGNNFIVNVATTLGVTNITNATGSNNYTNYSATHQVSAVQSTSVDFTVNTCGGGCSQSACKVFVDWNQNGNFTDPGEQVYSGTAAYVFAGTITVPLTAIPGMTRMRVVSDWTLASVFGFPTLGPCVSTSWGEVEDYGFLVIEAIPCEDPSIVFPTAATAVSAPEAVCESGPITLNLLTPMPVASGITYQWESSASTSGPWTTVSADLLTPSFATSISSDTYFRCNVKCSGTTATVSEPILVEAVVPEEPSVISGQTCGPGTVELVADGSGVMHWYDVATGGTVLSTGDAFVTPPLTANTTFYVAAGAFEGCLSDRVPVIAYVRDTPTVTIPIDDGVYCVFNGLFSIPTIPEQPETNTYRWNTGAVDSFITVGPSSGVTVQYWVEVTNEWGCTASDTLNVILNPSPFVELGPDTLICEDAMITVDAGTAGSSYYWNNGGTTSKVTVDEEGKYYVLVTNEFGCVTTDTINIFTEGWLPRVEGINVDNLAPQTFKFTAIDPAHILSYKWDFGDDSALSEEESPTHVYKEPGTYFVTLNVESSCGFNSFPAYVTVFTGTQGQELLAQSLNIYPNPSAGLLNIEMKGGEKMDKISILNVVGQTMSNTNAGNTDQYTLDVSMLPNGMYYLKVSSEKGIVMKKFQVIK